MAHFRGVLFDLDGTLLDTAPDMAGALNRLLEEENHPALPLERIRPEVSRGAGGLIRLGFGLEPDHPQAADLRQRFLSHYQRNICRETRLFHGMEAVLTMFEQAEIPWGIVTNKPAYLTEPLVAALELDTRSACIISGDTTAHSKPHPLPVLTACEQIGCSPSEALFIGDDARDVAAGRAAGATNLIALFGYLGVRSEPETWGADGSVSHPGEILSWVFGT
ncbi:MAG: HAD-IA family hydrolase [Pseudomonadota bacterium]|nr:HAD-IA family hydrolase [Pseudomonadota bacterium]